MIVKKKKKRGGTTKASVHILKKFCFYVCQYFDTKTSHSNTASCGSV